MRKYSWQTFHRTHAVETAHRVFQLYHDAEMLMGDADHTTAGEIERFFGRFSFDHDPGDYQKPTSEQIYRFWRKALEKKSIKFGQWEAQVIGFETQDCLGLTCSFTDQSWDRKHHIRIYEAEGRCIFIAKAADPETVMRLTNDQLVKLTWQRNAHIDIVEFMLDDESNLLGRAIRPVDGLTEKEFLYCAYTLTASTDRLEYLIQEPDLF